MALIYVGIGAIALAIGGGALGGILFAIELLVRSIGVGAMQYLLPAPVILLLCYFTGSAIHSLRKRR